eukprot:m.769630 g.769630  ORF g.769630 m.769630 type:complete len:88 (-) comp23235_c0_seq26:4352-4615(-)
MSRNDLCCFLAMVVFDMFITSPARNTWEAHPRWYRCQDWEIIRCFRSNEHTVTTERDGLICRLNALQWPTSTKFTATTFDTGNNHVH